VSICSRCRWIQSTCGLRRLVHPPYRHRGPDVRQRPSPAPPGEGRCSRTRGRALRNGPHADGYLHVPRDDDGPPPWPSLGSPSEVGRGPRQHVRRSWRRPSALLLQRRGVGNPFRNTERPSPHQPGRVALCCSRGRDASSAAGDVAGFTLSGGLVPRVLREPQGAAGVRRGMAHCRWRPAFHPEIEGGPFYSRRLSALLTIPGERCGSPLTMDARLVPVPADTALGTGA
jgi:hypothetical protein